MTTQPSACAFLRSSSQSGSQEQRLPTHQAVVLGRDPSCEIVLDSYLYANVSRRHAEITPLASSQP